VDELPRLAAELVRMNVDLIFAPSSTMVEAARQATQTIPIVFSNHADPVGIGHVASLARPGGNITGLSMLLTDLAVKELEILTEVVPHAKRIGVVWNPTTPSHAPAVRAIEGAGEAALFRSMDSGRQASRELVCSTWHFCRWYEGPFGCEWQPKNLL